MLNHRHQRYIWCLNRSFRLQPHLETTPVFNCSSPIFSYKIPLPINFMDVYFSFFYNTHSLSPPNPAEPQSQSQYFYIFHFLLSFPMNPFAFSYKNHTKYIAIETISSNQWMLRNLFLLILFHFSTSPFSPSMSELSRTNPNQTEPRWNEKKWRN